MRATDVQKRCAVGNEVGESPVWDDRARRLFWVDISGRAIFSHDPLTSDTLRWPTPEFITSIGLREDGGAIVGLERSVCFWDYGDEFRPIATIEPGLDGNRLNEGRVGPDGCFWVGTMQNNLAPDGSERPMTRLSGSVYRVRADGASERMIRRDLGIVNSLAWLGDRTFLYADTLANTFFRYRINGECLVEEEPFGSPFERGLPDGSALDSEGCLWNSRVGGGCIVRFDPEGVVDRIIELPCSSPTSCAFGGDDLETLFVTSARFGLDQTRRERPDEGALFALRPGSRGVPEHRFQC